MSTLQQLKQGLGRFWDSLSEGWQQLQQRADRTPICTHKPIINNDSFYRVESIK